MKVSAMRRIDRWLGAAVCFLLTALRKCKEFAGISESSLKINIRSILFVKLAEQGATVLAYNAISRAIQMAGRENVYFLVFEENRFILDLMNVIPPQNIFTINS